jgi:pyruvate/2-oxoglutarate dehydrogenase complex dihydrolipoamide acyltransferase (E2) component
MDDRVVRMPKLADTLVEGTLGQWLKQVGQTISQGEALASIETDKVTTELTSPFSGTLLEVLVAEGQTVPIETPIARIGQSPLPLGAALPPLPLGAALPPRPLGEAARSAGEGGASAPAPTPKPTPVAARLLKEHGLTPDQIASSSARLTKQDVIAFVKRQTPTKVAVEPIRPGELIALSPMRRAIADHMVKARQSIPHGQTVMAADLTRLVAWRDQHKTAFQQREGANLTFTVFFVYALARHAASLSQGPVDLGVAVALEHGLIVPVLRYADALSLADTARGIADLADRARRNKLAPDETQGAAMTVTNVGSFGNLTASPIIPLGQTAILGPGLVERRPMPAPDNGIRQGWRCLLSLMFDRRALTDLAADRLLRGVIGELLSIPDAR